MGQTLVDGEPAARERRRWITVTLAVLCVLLAPLGMLMSSGLLTPLGLPPAIASVVLAALVVIRTKAGSRPRWLAWALLGLAAVPWLFTAAWLIQIHAIDR